MLVKICGITTLEEIEYLNAMQPDFAGFVQYFPKSKRNISVSQAKELMKALDSKIQKVAVTVSPTQEQIRVLEEAGFDYLQIHGEMEDSLIGKCKIPVWKAFNVCDLSQFSHYETVENVVGYIFDALVPGSGKAFDWTLLEELPDTKKTTFLAGGLTPDNVYEALCLVKVSGVDTSSGVEKESGGGKSREKIQAFIHEVREFERKQVVQ